MSAYVCSAPECSICVCRQLQGRLTPRRSFNDVQLSAQSSGPTLDGPGLQRGDLSVVLGKPSGEGLLSRSDVVMSKLTAAQTVMMPSGPFVVPGVSAMPTAGSGPAPTPPPANSTIFQDLVDAYGLLTDSELADHYNAAREIIIKRVQAGLFTGSVSPVKVEPVALPPAAKGPPKCECGGEKHGWPHSTWCDIKNP